MLFRQTPNQVPQHAVHLLNVLLAGASPLEQKGFGPDLRSQLQRTASTDDLEMALRQALLHAEAMEQKLLECAGQLDETQQLLQQAANDKERLNGELAGLAAERDEMASQLELQAVETDLTHEELMTKLRQVEVARQATADDAEVASQAADAAKEAHRNLHRLREEEAERAAARAEHQIEELQQSLDEQKLVVMEAMRELE